MQQQDVVNLINGVGKLLKQKGSFVIYGPFNYNGLYTSKSNESFDQWLKQRDPLSGIKHFEEIVSLANDNGMHLVTDYEMPANNRILHFIKVWFFVATQRTQKQKDYHHEEHEAHEARFKQF